MKKRKGLVMKRRIPIIAGIVLSVTAGCASERAGGNRAMGYAASDLHNAVTITSEGTKPLGKAPENENDLPTNVVVWKLFIGETGTGTDRLIEVKYTKVATYTLARGEGIDAYLKEVALKRAPREPSGSTPAENEWKDIPPLDDEAERYRESPLSIRHDGYAYMVFVLDEKNWQFTAEREPFAVKRGKQEYYLDSKCAWRTSETTAKVGPEPPANVECKVASFISNAVRDRRTPTFKDRFRSPFNFYVSLKVPGKHGPRYLPLAIDPDVGYPGGSAP